METKFTPDLLREHADYILSVPDFVGSPDAIADALRWGADQAAINADLLEALEAMLNEHMAHHNNPVHASARAAIARATGEE